MRRPEAAFASPDSASVATELGRAVRLARLGRNLTQADFAERARVSVATLQRIEKGDPAVSFTSWLSALEASGLLPALKEVADPALDARGAAQRKMDERKRATGSRTRRALETSYDF